jgi:peroxiredoxin Q/BCP
VEGDPEAEGRGARRFRRLGGLARQVPREVQLPFPLLSDPDRGHDPYGAFGEKTMYGKKVQGVIRSTVWIGKDGVVRKHWARVAKAEAHPEAVLEALRAGR